jgi:hypothetical protein
MVSTTKVLIGAAFLSASLAATSGCSKRSGSSTPGEEAFPTSVPTGSGQTNSSVPSSASPKSVVKSKSVDDGVVSI